MSKFKVGTRVMVAEDNDNENYDSFRHLTLVVTSIATNRQQHPGYDDSMGGMPLYDLETKDGNSIGSSLYEYELDAKRG